MNAVQEEWIEHLQQYKAPNQQHSMQMESMNDQLLITFLMKQYIEPNHSKLNPNGIEK